MGGIRRQPWCLSLAGAAASACRACARRTTIASLAARSVMFVSEIAYAIIGRGGFLGMGQEHVAMPWQRMRATPNLDTFVLNMCEEQFESAPTVNPNAFATDEGYTTQRGEIDRFWDASRAG
jgi:hypothetical protein